ncbi:MAG: Exopolysaccharide production protein ExoZ [Myxococcales bacterium]|nr:Exopolysaccharide production protein ExoZ [Myxococcales bacterium]
MLYNVQILRAVAAVLVVHAHAAGVAGLGLAWDGGAHGVDLFFVLSGFIIAYVGSLDTSQFMVRRLIRIVPIYWSSTVALYALVLVMPSLFRSTSADPELLVKSMLFVPDGSHVQTSDGIPHPTLAGGWTLNYEMYFYVLFGIAIAFSKKWATLITTALITAVVIVVHVTSLDARPEAHFYGYPIVFEFAFGMLVFHLLRVAEASAKVTRPGAVQKWLLIAVIVIGFTLLAFSEMIFGPAPRWIVAGIPSFAILLAAVVLERVHDVKITNRFAVMVGDASYVLYLIQAYVLYGVIRLVIGKRQFAELPGQLLTLPLMALSVVASIAVYKLYEQPILRVLKRKVIHSRPRAGAAVSAGVAPASSAR